MVNRIFVFVVIQSVFVCSGSNVVFLYGAASAGKSSLSEALSKHESWKVVSEDDIFCEHLALRLKEEFFNEYEAIVQAVDVTNLLHAVMRNQILFKSDAAENSRDRARKAIVLIQNELNSRPRDSKNQNSWSNRLRQKITDIILGLAATHNVMVDTWFIKPEHVAQISQRYKVHNVLAYCPFLGIIQRTIKRNSDALLMGKDVWSLRFFHQALKSFIGLYDLSDNSKDSLDVLDKETAVHGLDIVSLCVHDSPHATGATQAFTRGEFSLEEFEQYRQDLLRRFVSERVYIVPKLKIDMVIRTDKLSPSDCAKAIAMLV